MVDYSKPESMSVEELARFLLDRQLRNQVGHMYNDGIGAVDDVLAEAAKRLFGQSGGKGGVSGE